jgi:hypothetical protein
MHFEQSAKLSIELSSPFDGALEPAEPQHQCWLMRHKSLPSRYSTKHSLADFEEYPRHYAGAFDFRNRFHKNLPRKALHANQNAFSEFFPQLTKNS